MTPELLVFDSNRVKLLRVKLGLTQLAFARRVGCSEGTVVRWEGGGSPPKAGPLLQKLLELEQEVGN